MSIKEAVDTAVATGCSAILIDGMAVIVDTSDAEAAEARGVEFSWLMAHHGKPVSIPNYTAGK